MQLYICYCVYHIRWYDYLYHTAFKLSLKLTLLTVTIPLQMDICTFKQLAIETDKLVKWASKLFTSVSVVYCMNTSPHPVLLCSESISRIFKPFALLSCQAIFVSNAMWVESDCVTVVFFLKVINSFSLLTAGLILNWVDILRIWYKGWLVIVLLMYTRNVYQKVFSLEKTSIHKHTGINFISSRIYREAKRLISPRKINKLKYPMLVYI